MYRVSYYASGSKLVTHREFDSLQLAVDFSLEQPTNSVFEIRLIKSENEIYNIND